MIYPKFLKPNDKIGICAPSRGIDLEDVSFDLAINAFKMQGYGVLETANVRSGKLPSADAVTRAKEFNELMQNEDIDFIYSASGGDFLMEILPHIDEDLIKEKIASGSIKWFAGYSDPTSLLYYLTTKFDVATLYGTNAGSFDQEYLYRNLKDALCIIKGDIPVQESFEKCERVSFEEKETRVDGNYILNTPDIWKTPNGDVDISGRLIGGCIDCLKYLVGTKYDYTKEFIERYKDDGIVWYFDNFALKTEDLYFTLWQMKETGWFKYAKGFVFGKTLFEGTETGLSYEDAVTRALGKEVPIIMEADIGHVKPAFSVINGAKGRFISKDGKGSLEMNLK